MNIAEIIKTNEKIRKELNDEAPYNTKSMFVDFRIDIYGDQICFGEDFKSLDDAREGVEYLVKLLGGKTTWKNK